jgi:hypothetical protein
MTTKRMSQGKKRKAIPCAIGSKYLRTGKHKRRDGTRIVRSRDGDDADAYWEKERKRQKMQLKFEDGKLFITLPRIDPPRVSGSGKSHLIASTYGIKRTQLLVEGLPVHVVATAFVYGYGQSFEPPVRWEPLFELPKSNGDDPKDEDEDDEREWATVPLLG